MRRAPVAFVGLADASRCCYCGAVHRSAYCDRRLRSSVRIFVTTVALRPHQVLAVHTVLDSMLYP